MPLAGFDPSCCWKKIAPPIPMCNFPPFTFTHVVNHHECHQVLTALKPLLCHGQSQQRGQPHILLGVAVLVGLVEVYCFNFIASIRTSGSSKMHSEAVIPRMGRGRNTGGAMNCWVPVADAAIPVASGGGGGLVSSVDAPL